MKGELTVRIADMPKVLAGIRHEVAVALRILADDEPTAVARRLREVAAAVEAGQGVE